MSWIPPSNNQHLLSIYKNNIKDRIKALKQAKRLRLYAPEIALTDPAKMNPADFLFISMVNRYYNLFAEESELIRKGIEADLDAWMRWKQHMVPFPSESLLEELF